jgi:hypothetical protein
MTKKVTGSDLAKLINEAMGLKMEAPDDEDIGFDSELGDELFDALPVEDPQELENTKLEPVTNSKVSDEKVPGEALFYPRWKPGKVDSEDQAVAALKTYKNGAYYKNDRGTGHEKAIHDLAEIANSEYYNKKVAKPEFFSGELSDGKIFDFLSSDNDKRNEILDSPSGSAAARRIKKYLNNLAQKLPKSYTGQRAMAASLATKDPKDLEKTKKDAFARPRIGFDKEFSKRGQIKTIPRYIKSVFDALINTNTSAVDRIEKLTNISIGLANVEGPQPQAAAPVRRSDLKPSQKFSSLIIVDFFRQITQFSKSTPLEAGNFFESFLALLFNGTVEGGQYDLEDVLLPFTGEANGTTSSGEPAFISAKFIGNQTNVSQSGDTVKKFFKVHGDNAKIMYIVAEKDFYKVTTGTKKVDGKDVETTTTTPRADYRGMKIYVKTYSKEDVDEKNGVVFYNPGEKPINRGTGKEEDAIKGSGKYVFTSIFDEDPVGEFKFAINEEIYKKKMEQKFEALKGGISDMYANLNNLEENLTIFYSSPAGDSKKETAADEAEGNINSIENNYNKFIATNKDDGSRGEDSQGDAMVKLGQDPDTRSKQRPVSNDVSGRNVVTLEQKVTSDFLKKIIEESFKR